MFERAFLAAVIIQEAPLL